MDSRSLKMQHSVDAGTHAVSNTAGASGFVRDGVFLTREQALEL